MINDTILTYITAAVVGLATVSMGATALDSAVNSYASSRKLGEHEVCIAKSHQYTLTRDSFEAACIQKADAKIDTALAPIKSLLSLNFTGADQSPQVVAVQ